MYQLQPKKKEKRDALWEINKDGNRVHLQLSQSCAIKQCLLTKVLQSFPWAHGVVSFKQSCAWPILAYEQLNLLKMPLSSTVEYYHLLSINLWETGVFEAFHDFPSLELLLSKLNWNLLLLEIHSKHNKHIFTKSNESKGEFYSTLLKVLQTYHITQKIISYKNTS